MARGTLAKVVTPFDVHPNKKKEWSARLLETVSEVFDTEYRRAQPLLDIKTLPVKISGLALENIDFLTRAHQSGILSAKR